MEQPGWAWIKNQQRPICELYEIKRGKNKGKVVVTLCRGRSDNGTINRGINFIIPFSSVIEFPEEVG